MAKGQLEGRLEGMAEEKMKIAMNLLKTGLSVDTIAEVTELNPDEVKKLFDKNK